MFPTRGIASAKALRPVSSESLRHIKVSMSGAWRVLKNTVEGGGGGRSQRVSQAMGEVLLFIFFSDKGDQQRALSRK